MVVVLLVVLFLALVSVGLWAYSRILLTSAAAQAARYAANADVPDSAATARAQEIMSHSLAAGTAGTVRCSPESGGGVLIEVHCTMQAPGLLPLLNGVMPAITVTAHTVREQP